LTQLPVCWNSPS